MMPNTPRTFVGSVAFELRPPPSADAADDVRMALARLEGVSSCTLDEPAGVLLVTARSPVDRAEVVALLERLGCRVEA
jgi:hypothetical protein